LYGEYLIPHTVKAYREEAWREYYVFDVMDGDDYLTYEQYRDLLEEFDIEYIPYIEKLKNPSEDRMKEVLDKNRYLIDEKEGERRGEAYGEGIVIKNYDYINKYGRTTWGKCVRNDFKDKFHKAMGGIISECKMVEEEIVEKYCTESLIEKTYAKIKTLEDGWSSKYIPRFLSTVFHDFIIEETWAFIKEHKNPKIDFKNLQRFVNNKIKQVKPDIF